MSITINYYPTTSRKFATGLGQDVGSLRTLVNMLQIFIPNSLIQLQAKEVLKWRMVDDDKRKTDILRKLSNSPVRLTVSELSAEIKKVPGEPAPWQIKGVLQAIMPGQKQAVLQDGSLVFHEGHSVRAAMRSWPIRNFLSTAIGLGLLNWNRITGDVSLSKDGYQLATAEHLDGASLSEAEKSVLRSSYMSYPYAVGFLRALEGQEKGLNKFELGEKFGFAGEGGFTSFGEDLYISSMKEAYRQNNKEMIKTIRSNWESTSDKYIRGLASTLSQLDLVKIDSKPIYFTNSKTNKTSSFSIPVYSLTGLGRYYLGIALGRSKHKRTTKIVTWDMLATKGNVTYVRTVRALILKELTESKGLTAEQLSKKINENKINKKQVLQGIIVSPEEVVDHISGLNGIGLQIDFTMQHRYELKDPISDFEIPISAKDLPQKDNVQHEQDELRPLLKRLDHRYLQLVELALDSDQNSEYSQFESLTMELLLRQLDFKGKVLGGSSKPDGIAWDDEGNFLIVDTKAYNNGYSLAGNTDKVARYIDDVRSRNPKLDTDWWKVVPESLDVKTNLRFMYVSGKFAGNYLKLLTALRTRTNARGGLTTVEKLLLTAEYYLREENYTHQSLLDDWTNNNIDRKEYLPKLRGLLKDSII